MESRMITPMAIGASLFVKRLIMFDFMISHSV